MDIRSLISVLENIESLNRAPVVEAEDPAAVIAKYTDKPDMPAYIDSKDGKVKYMDNNMDRGRAGQAKVMPTDWIERYAPDLAAALRAQGGNQQGYGAQQKGGLFGIKGLGNFDQGTTVNTKQAGADASSKSYKADKLKQLSDLVAKLNAEGGGNTDPTVGKVDYSLGGGSSPGMKLKESILREFGYEVDEGGITLGADGKVDPNGHTPEKQMALSKMVGDNMNAAAGKDAIIKQIQAIMAELGQSDQAYATDPDVIKALGIAQKAIDAASKKPDAAKPTTDTPVAGKPDATAAANSSGEAVGKSLQRFKELLAKASEPATAATPTAPAKENISYFLEKMRVLESQLNEALTPDEQKELDQLAQSYGDSEDPEITGLLKQYGDAKNAALNATPGSKPTSTTATKKKSMTPVDPKVQALQNDILAIDPKALPKYGADGRMGSETQTAMKDARFKVALDKYNGDGSTATKPSTGAAGGASAVPADASTKEPYWVNGTRYEYKMSGGGRGQAATGKWEPTATPTDKLQWNSTRARSMAKYTGPDSAYGKTDAANPTDTTAAEPTASTTATKPATTTSNQSVSGTLKMGKADGSITYNGKTVNPGDPEYATAEQALIRAQGKSQQARTRQPNNPALASTPVQQGASQQKDIDFESVVREDNAILAMIRGIKV